MCDFLASWGYLGIYFMWTFYSCIRHNGIFIQIYDRWSLSRVEIRLISLFSLHLCRLFLIISSIDMFILIPEGNFMLGIVLHGSRFWLVRVGWVLFCLLGVDGKILVYFASGEEMVGVYLFGCYGDLYLGYF